MLQGLLRVQLLSMYQHVRSLWILTLILKAQNLTSLLQLWILRKMRFFLPHRTNFGWLKISFMLELSFSFIWCLSKFSRAHSVRSSAFVTMAIGSPVQGSLRTLRNIEDLPSSTNNEAVAVTVAVNVLHWKILPSLERN